MNVRVALLQIASQHTKSGQRGVAGCPRIPGQIKSVWVAGSPRNTHQVEKRPPKLDLDVYPYLPKANVATTSAASYMSLMQGQPA